MFDSIRRLFTGLAGAAENVERLRDSLGQLADTAREINDGVRGRLGMNDKAEPVRPALPVKRVKSQ